MGVFKKLKDVLFDVEEEEIPVITKEIKKEPIKEENPIKEVKIPKEDVAVKKEISSFNFPLDIDEKPMSRVKKDYDFDEEFNSRRNTYQEPPKKKEPTNDYNRYFREEAKRPEPTKPFTPTPIISPVYGILDQNYTKDDVIVKTDIGVKTPDLDDVRRKAYGIEKKTKETKKTVIEVEDEFTEPLKSLDEILINKEEEKEKETVVLKDEFVIPDEISEEPIYEEKTKNTEDTLETDLFNLIDSMYEEKKESEEEE